MKKWWTFLAERFPLSSHTPMIAAFTAGNLALAQTLFEPVHAFLAFVIALSFFLRLRIFDEIKDYETDLVVNPTRPLARGLISVKEAKKALVILFFFEIGLLALLAPALLATHAIAMLYSLLMYKEFFIGNMLRPHLTTYAVLHTLVSVLVGASIVSMASNQALWQLHPSTLYLLFINWALFNLFEFARKTFAPEEERDGVESYSKVFSLSGAVLLSLSQVILPNILIFNILGGSLSSMQYSILWLPTLLVIGPSLYFVINRKTQSAKIFRGAVGAYLIVAYIAVAIAIKA